MTLVVPLLFAVHAAAGTASIGGGQGEVCRSPKGEVVSAELTDLAEVPYRSKLSIPNVKGEPETLASQAMARMAFAFHQVGYRGPKPESFLRILLEFKEDVPKGHKIFAPQDHGREQAIFIKKKPGCEIESIGYRELVNGGRTVLRISDAYAALSNVHKAAFWVHEAMYSYYLWRRQAPISPERGTIDIRHLTAVLMSDQTTLQDILIASRFLFISASGEGVLYVDSSQAGARAEFIGQTNPLVNVYSLLTPRDESNFACVESSSGSRIASRAERTSDGNYVLKIQEHDSCLSRLSLKGLSGILAINGQNVLETLTPLELDVVFLGDNPSLKSFREQARYPFASHAPGKNGGLTKTAKGRMSRTSL